MPAVFEPKSIRKEYSEKELADLREKYTPAQMEAIQASEEDMNNKTLQQARQRADPWSLNYFDDLSEVHPVVDKPIRAPASNTDPNLRLKTGDELAEDLARFAQNYPDNPKDTDSWIKWQQKLRLTVGKPEAEFNPRSAMAPELTSTKPAKPKKKEGAAGGREEEEASPALVRLMQMTGYNRQQIAGLRVKSIISHNVVNQTRLGKIRKQYFLSIAGNGQGLIGIGEGKAEEPQEARLQSQYRAIRNMQPILRYEGRTIFGDVTGKVSATELELYARPPGFGLRCQQYIWEICKCAGIADLAARVTRSRNPMNTVKATVEALLSQKDPEEIAKARGKKMVDVRKVYYAGLV